MKESERRKIDKLFASLTIEELIDKLKEAGMNLEEERT